MLFLFRDLKDICVKMGESFVSSLQKAPSMAVPLEATLEWSLGESPPSASDLCSVTSDLDVGCC